MFCRVAFPFPMSRFLLVTLISLSGCQCRKSAFVPPVDSLLLPIPDRQWAEGAPEEGWCGETSIQMIGLHYGMWAPQSVINARGRSTHVDLWEEDIPGTLGKLGFDFEPGPRGDRDDFIAWIIGQLRLGHPVIVGAKLFPSDHPEWDVDHLMPIVGFSPTGLVFNTNLEWQQREISWASLAGSTEGISFVSPAAKLFGYAVKGLRHGPPYARLKVLEESPRLLKLSTRVEGGAWLVRVEHVDGGVSTQPMTPELELDPREVITVRPQ